MLILAKIRPKELSGLDSTNKVTVFLGGDCKDNAWRESLKLQFPDVLFLDPYDPGWEPERNIYSELAAALKADYAIFYKGGSGSRNEKKFLDYTGYGYEEFKDLDALKKYLAGLSKPNKQACASALRRIAGRL